MSLKLERLIAEPIDIPHSASWTMTRFIPMEMKRCGVELSLVIEVEVFDDLWHQCECPPSSAGE